jgi:hypothetical protein
MEPKRRSEAPAFNSNPDTGRRGYRMGWEAPDDRPLIVYHEGLWADDTERMTYEAACEDDRPRDEDTLLDYLSRVSAAVEGKYKRLPTMPQGLRVPRGRKLEQRRQGMPSKMEIL